MRHKGFKHSKETIEKIRKANLGQERSKESKEKMRQAKIINPTRYWLNKKRPEVLKWILPANIGRNAWNKDLKLPQFSGENSASWIKDRTKIKVSDRSLNDPLQKGWRKAVKNRDGWKCRISDEKCSGGLEAHHILPWSKFPELRYQINNGITLCHAHHPRSRDEVAKLSPFFQSLVAEMK